MARDEKYIVFKRSDWLKEAELTSFAVLFEDNAVDDAVVIRLQDLFAGPALHHYASSIQTMLDLFTSLAVKPTMPFTPYPDMLQRLGEIRDYFHDAAVEADRLATKKVPD